MKEYLGKTPYGMDIYAHTIADGDISITVLDYGATLQKFVHKGTDIVCGYDTLDSYINAGGYLGATVGRYANRIGGGKITIDGEDYLLPRNDGEAHLHGGVTGFSHHTWNVEEGVTHDGCKALTCGYISPDGEEGYPGRLIATVSYIIKEDSLIVDYYATTDKPTYCCMTNHSYFNLHGCDKPGVLDHKLTVFADNYTDVDPKTLLPTGKRLPTAGTAFDFRTEKDIGADFDKTGLGYPGYDHNFLLRRTDKTQYKKDGPFLELVRKTGFAELDLRRAAVCRVPEREMTVLTTMPCMQVYTGNFLGDGPDFKGGVRQEKYHGVCFETQYEPDSPSKGLARLNPGEKYHHVTVFRLK